jgi:hypothetical protein
MISKSSFDNANKRNQTNKKIEYLINLNVTLILR